MEKPTCLKCPPDSDYTVEKGPAHKTMRKGPDGVWDEEGNYHPPIDPNMIKQEYSCSNGHTWTEKRPADPNAEEKRKRRKKAREKGLL